MWFLSPDGTLTDWVGQCPPSLRLSEKGFNQSPWKAGCVSPTAMEAE